MPSRLLSTFWKKDHSSSLLKKVRKYLSSSPRWHLRQKIHWSIFWIKNVQNFFTHLMREFEKKNRIYLFGQQQAQSNCILYYKRPLELLYYFLWEIFGKGKIALENFPWNYFVYLLDFSCSSKLTWPCVQNLEQKGFFRWEKRGHQESPLT